MDIRFNTNDCSKSGVPVGTFLYLLSLYLEDPINLKKIKDSGKAGYIMYENLLNSEPIGVELNEEGRDLVEDIIFAKPLDSHARYSELADKLRELFPQGKRDGKYMWRDSNAIISKRLESVSKKYNITFTDEEAINATRRYVASYNGDFTNMRLLKYFLFKRDRVTGEESSDFLSFLENGDEESISQDWKSEMR